MKRRSRRSIPYKIISMGILAALLISGSNYSFAKTEQTSNQSKVNVESIVQKGQEILREQKQKANLDAKNKLGITKADINKATNKPFAPKEKVRLIVELTDEPLMDIKTSVFEEKKKLKTHDQVINQLTKKRIKTKLRHQFVRGFNGFSIETEFRNMDAIKKINGVANVSIANTYSEAMKSSKGLVQAQQVWEELGFKGEGMLVGVVDSGVDYRHKDMVMSDKGKGKEKLTKENIQSKLDETEVDDRWYTDKVPTGYDWADKDDDVLPYESSHGMHVSGTIGANGDEEKDGVKGIAPNVQILAEKVFSDNGGGAYEDDIVAGINHAVEMGADVINLSLGSDGGFVGEEDDTVQKAIRLATNNGVLVVAAGGNAYYSTKNDKLSSSTKPYADNPDIGILGSPGVSPYALQVASYENNVVHKPSLKLTTGDEIAYYEPSYLKLKKAMEKGKEYPLVFAGKGSANDYKNIDVKNKIAVVQPDIDLGINSHLQFNAQDRGAIAVIIAPTPAWGDYKESDFSPYSIPAVVTSVKDGKKLINELQNGRAVSAQLSGGLWVENPNHDEISDFSSIGAPHTLDFKPEITAPGGGIYSTVFDNQYDVYSGTSMATPHVVGGATLVLQSFYEKGLPKNMNTILKTKTALMNTSKIEYDPNSNNKIPYSPRKQGAGMMQIKNALQTPVLIENKAASAESKGSVALKEIKNQMAQFDLNVIPLSEKKSEEVEYNVYLDVLTDDTEYKEYDLNGDGKPDRSHDYLTLSSKRVKNAVGLLNGKEISYDKPVKIKVKDGKKQNVHVDLILPKDLRKNSFVEGFVRFVPVNKDLPELSMPYMGFYGQWDSLKNIDSPAWDKDVFLGYTVLWDEMSEMPLGYDAQTGEFNMNHIAYSPNSVLSGVYPSFTVFRNLKEVNLSVENNNGKKIRQLGNFSEFTPDGSPWKFSKNIMAYNDFSVSAEVYPWDATDDQGKVVPDGEYQLTITSTLDYKNAKPQKVKMPVKIDSVAPTIDNIKVEPVDGKYKISWNAEDNEGGSGYDGAILWINGQYQSIPEGATSYLSKVEPKGMVIIGIDWALNVGFNVWGDPGYINQDMLINYLGIYGSNVNEDAPLQINGFAIKKVDWKFKIAGPDGKIVDTFDVKHQAEIHMNWKPEKDLPDGTYSIYTEAIDSDGFKVQAEPTKFTVKQKK
ncbi:S8 family serine peptidase [Heyndrickxia sporothermodurans]|nr:S8 family serine peptidase [Heyndrickxia sporothermodurans]MED3781796.1 S8 family serine peptidase [Heyndrickxia sporothermodurans]